MSEKRLVRATDDRMVAGVCAGLAHYFGLDPVLVRIVFLLLLFGGGHGLLIYLILWVLMPEAHVMAKYNGFDPDEVVVEESV